MQRADYLIDYLLKENSKLKLNIKPRNPHEKFELYRRLCNIRQVKPISDEFIKQEKSYLQEINRKRNITDVDNIEKLNKTHPINNISNDDKISLWQGDITRLKIDAIVNAANSQGLGCFVPGHNCIDNQIHTYSGVSLRLECDEYMKTIQYNLPTGEAFLTKGYNLPTKYVIHTVGPIIENKLTSNKKKELANCYINSLELAKENNIKTVAFCSISTGVFRFPKELASKIAIKTVDDYLNDNGYFNNVVFNVYSNEDVKIYEHNI